MGTGDQRQDPVEALLDLLLYAPLGLVTQLDELLPGLIERGRSQAVMARTIGEFAVRTGSQKVQGRALDTQKVAEDTARALIGALSAMMDRVSSAQDPARTSSEGGSDSSSSGSAQVPIPGYEDLRAAEIIPLLDGLDPQQRAEVADLERAGRARKTILNRLAQLDRSE